DPLRITLGDFLDEMGVKLDCYFTIEEQTGPERQNAVRDSHCVARDEKIGSVGQLVAKLNKELRGFLAFQSETNPAVVHIVDSRLMNDKNYLLNSKTSLCFKGPVQFLVDTIGEKMNWPIHSRRWGSFGGRIPVLDIGTQVEVAAEKMEVR